MLAARRENFSKINRKIGSAFSRAGISPNVFTLITLVLAFATFYFLFIQNFFIAALFLIITGFFDIIDGAVARYSKKVTDKGGYLDTIVDRYIEFIIISGLLFSINVAWVFLYIFGSLMTTYAKAAAFEKMRKEVKGGFIDRSERLIILFIGVLLGGFNLLYLAYIVIILAIITNISAIHRIYTAMK